MHYIPYCSEYIIIFLVSMRSIMNLLNMDDTKSTTILYAYISAALNIIIYIGY